MASLIGVVLAGGRSRRFGSDKALHELDGQSLLERAASKLKALGLEVYISVNEKQVESLPEHMHWIKDRYDDQGPLGGLLTVHEAFPESDLFVLACDLIHVEVEDLKRILSMADQEENIIHAISAKDRKQPLLGIWKKEALGGIQSYLQKGGRAAKKYVKGFDCLNLIYDNYALTNMNAPTDLEYSANV
jgi:molybdopterin-guanine dinucleotide biosynthesis protein A